MLFKLALIQSFITNQKGELVPDKRYVKDGVVVTDFEKDSYGKNTGVPMLRVYDSKTVVFMMRHPRHEIQMGLTVISGILDVQIVLNEKLQQVGVEVIVYLDQNGGHLREE